MKTSRAFVIWLMLMVPSLALSGCNLPGIAVQPELGTTPTEGQPSSSRIPASEMPAESTSVQLAPCSLLDEQEVANLLGGLVESELFSEVGGCGFTPLDAEPGSVTQLMIAAGQGEEGKSLILDGLDTWSTLAGDSEIQSRLDDLAERIESLAMTELMAETADLWKALNRKVEVDQTPSETTLWVTATSEFFSQSTVFHAENNKYVALTLTDSDLGDREALQALAESALGRLPELFHVLGSDSADFSDSADGDEGGQIAAAPSETPESISTGKVWVASHNADQVYVIDMRVEQVVSTIDVGRGPTDIISHGGSVWVLNTREGSLQRIDAETFQLTETIIIKPEMHSLAAGNGSLWVAGYHGVQEIELSTGAVHNVYSGNSSNVVVAENAVWVTRTFDNQVLKIDPQTRSILTSIDLEGAPAELTYGSGSVWIVLAKARKIVRVDPESAEVLSTIPPYTSIRNLAFADDLLWLSGGNTSRQGAIYALDPQTEDITRYAILPHYPRDMVFFGEFIWATSPSEGMIMRFNPATKRTEVVIDVGSDPSAIAVTE